jgi:hypothetical protein
LVALCKFGARNRFWPSRVELVKSSARIGGLTTTFADLKHLEREGLVRFIDRCSESYWQPTEAGFAWARFEPFTLPKPPSRKARNLPEYGIKQRARKEQLRRAAAQLDSDDDLPEPAQLLRQLPARTIEPKRRPAPWEPTTNDNVVLSHQTEGYERLQVVE